MKIIVMLKNMKGIEFVNILVMCLGRIGVEYVGFRVDILRL